MKALGKIKIKTQVVRRAICLFIVLNTILLALSSLLINGQAKAISNIFPDSSVGSNDNAIVAIAGGSVAITAPTAYYLIHVPANLQSVNISVPGFCNKTWEYRLSFNSQATFYIYAMNSDEEAVAWKIKESYFDKRAVTSATCTDSYDIDMTSVSTSTLLGHRGYKVLMLRMEQWNGGLTRYKVQANNADVKISFRPVPFSTIGNSDDKAYTAYGFAVVDNGLFTGSTAEGNFSFQFSGDCRLPLSGATAWLKWNDADYGQNNQDNNNIRFILKDLTAGTSLSLWRYGWNTSWTQLGWAADDDAVMRGVYAELGGANEFRKAAFTAYPGHQYSWEWYDVTHKNGVQVWLPFSQMSGTIGCFEAIPTSSGPTYAEPGDTVTFIHEVSADGNQDTSGTYKLKDGLDNIIKEYEFSADVVAPFVNATNGSDVYFVDGYKDDGSKNWVSDLSHDFTIPTTAVIGSQYCEKLEINWSNLPSVVSTPHCVRVVARPYVKFFGADVGFCGGAGNVYTSAKLFDATNPNPDYYVGSSAQYALYAYGAVNDSTNRHGFYTNSQFATGSPPNPKYLTFANVGTDTGTLGGNWDGNPANNSATPACHNYYTEAANNPPPVAANRVISSATAINSNQTVYVNGHASINSNITYNNASSSWASPDAVPSYRLIVKGNIYINGGVTQLDGFYFATGKIYTCTPAIATIASLNAYTPSFPGYDTCKNQLTVNGSLQANGGIKYWRTSPTLSSAGITETYDNNKAAETIIFSPEMLLSNWKSLPAGRPNTSSSEYLDAIKNLPPIF